MLQTLLASMNPNDILKMLTTQIDTPEKVERIKENLKRIPLTQESKNKILELCAVVSEAISENQTIDNPKRLN